MNIYTKNGDKGMTDLLSGGRTFKDDPIITLLGHIDETTSHLGLARVSLDAENKVEIKEIQNKLIQVMGVISSGFTKEINLEDDVSYFEKRIDEFQESFPKLTGFVIPGEDETSSRLDIARTLVRRSERQLVSLEIETISKKDISRYLNRLSDYLFAMARMVEFREQIKKAVLDMPHIEDESSHSNIRNINFTIARKLADKVIEKAEKEDQKIVVSIVNTDGVPYLTYRMDDAFIISFGLARKKAYTAAALKMPTHELNKLTSDGQPFYGLKDMLDEEIVSLGGGYPIKVNHSIIGAIGVSGGSVESDMALAKYGADLIEDIINVKNG